MSQFCMHCGTALPEAARFCSSCGALQSPLRGPLMRPHFGRRIAGVCLALSRAYGWDLAIVRVVAFLCLCLSAGFVGIAYIACWIGIPEEPLGGAGEYPPHV